MSEKAPINKPKDDNESLPSPPAKAQTRPSSGLACLYQRIEPFEIWIVVGLAMMILIPGMWAYTLIDPWETHYAEVARRILADSDWVHLRAEDISFRSKPVLTPWLIAGSMSLFGVASDGSYSGELAASGPLVNFAIRLPFTLFAVMGLSMVWNMLAKLVNRRVAWIAFIILVTSPYFFLVARQSITDMPMVATLMGALSCFALAANAPEQRIVPFWKGVTSLHVFLAVVTLVVGGQLVYYFYYFLSAHPGVVKGIGISPGLVLWPFLLIFIGWLASLHPILRFTVTTKRQVYMFWFFLLMGISVLAKGPPGIALAGLVCLLYVLMTGSYKLLLKLELIRGVTLTMLVALPWHFAMYLKDGPAWYAEYIHVHMLNRFGKGVHGDRGTFDYFASQLGIGMWPWIALLPAALAAIFLSARRDNSEGRTRLLIGIWAIAAYATFCVSETKFHHYALPVVPALAILIAFWIDDLLNGRVRKSAMMILVAVPIVGLLARDFVGEQKQLIELFIYRYDRVWPSGEPWNLDLTSGFMWFGLAFAVLMGLLVVERIRKYTVAALLGCGLAFGMWTMNVYMPAAAKHWGQQGLHKKYYETRGIQGVDYQYYSLRDLTNEWSGDSDIMVESIVPSGFVVGAPMKIQIFVPGAGVPKDLVVLSGQVAKLGDNRFWISVPASERSKLSELIARGQGQSPSRRKRWKQVAADRMVAWQLNWHGEDFWTGGEMYGDRDDAKTIFKKTDNKRFLKWIKDPERTGRTFYIVTESGRAKGLRGILPTPRAKETFEIIDTSCNKFSLVRFSL